MKSLGIGCGIFVAVVFVGFGIFTMTPMFHRWYAVYTNDIKEPYIVQDAHIRVSTYEWFYDMYGEIEATRKKAQIAAGSQEEKGIRMVLEGMIAEYNAMASKKATRAQWMPTDLPYKIE